MFLIYSNDLSDGLQCNTKLFADDTSLFATVHSINKATNDLNKDLTKITKWGFQWKMSFNPNISKQAHEIIFPRKRCIAFHPPATFNKIPVADANSQKHLGMKLDKELNFEEHLSKVGSMVNTTIGIIGKLRNLHPRSALLQLLSYKHCLIRCSTVMNFLTSHVIPPTLANLRLACHAIPTLFGSRHEN